MSQAFYRAWRPRRWEDVLGQDHVVVTLHNAVTADRIAHAYLFSGPRGTGKTTTARLLAKAANCLSESLADRPCDTCDHCQAVNQGRFLDLIEIDAASNTSVDDVRDLRDKINFTPNAGRYKVYIVDEVHMLSTAAFNALLKTLEEPPPHAIFILATTEVHKIPATVLSRCQRHEFRRIAVSEILAQLDRIVEKEKIEIDPDALGLVARQAGGSMRDAISLLDQLASTGQHISLESAQQVLGTATSQAVLDLVDSILGRDAKSGLDVIRTTLDSGSDPRQFARQMVEYLRGVLLTSLGSGQQVDATAEVHSRMAVHAREFGGDRLLIPLKAFNRAASDNRSSWNPGLPLELALMESLSAMEDLNLSSQAGEGIQDPEASAPTGMKSPGTADAPPKTPKSRSKEAPSVPAPDAEEDPAESGDPLTPRNFALAWPEVLVQARRRNPQTQGLLNSCRPLGVKDNTLLLGFSNDLIKSKMEKPEHLAVAREALAEVLGIDLQIRCVISAAVRGDKLKDLEGVDREGIVAFAVRDLGGEIVDIQ